MWEKIQRGIMAVLTVILTVECFFVVEFLYELKQGVEPYVPTPTQEEIFLPEKKKEIVVEAPKVAPAIVHPYDSMTYRPDWKANGIANLRKVDYGVGSSKKIHVQTHTGGYVLDLIVARKTVEAVFQRLPNIKTSEGLVDLIVETMITETWMGREPWIKSIKAYKNYGIVQFRLETAKETVNWLKAVRSDVHEALMKFYDDDESFEWNVTYNVPFGIALAVEYYWRVIPNINDRVTTLEDRAQCWKGFYNTTLGLGTVNKYIKRVNKFKKKYMEAQDNFVGPKLPSKEKNG